VQSWPGGLRVTDVKRAVELAVPPEAVISDPLGVLIATAKLAALKAGQKTVAWTEKAPATLEAAMGLPFSLTAARLQLVG
jgi:hypothetical protein